MLVGGCVSEREGGREDVGALGGFLQGWLLCQLGKYARPSTFFDGVSSLIITDRNISDDISDDTPSMPCIM
jgi:hypothetical protein